MDPSTSSSRPTSSSSTWLDDAPPSESASSVSDTSRSTPDKRPSSIRKQPIPSRSRLSRPFRSPIKRSQPEQSMDLRARPRTASEQSPDHEPTEAASSSSAAVRKQRQALEGRLLLLQQANKCLREGALSTLPPETARWREAAQLAAQDLWKLTGAEGGDWSATGGIPSRGDYGLESPPSTFSDATNPHKRKASESPPPSSPPWLLRRSRFASPGAEEEAAALRSTDDPVQRLKGDDSQGTGSQTSLPEIPELIRRSQSIVGASSTPAKRPSQRATPIQEASASSTASQTGRGIERKWNIGSMLDMLGADKATLDWDVEEEDFREPETSAGVARQLDPGTG